MSTIALCIPAYNAAWCLPRLLISAKNQVIPFDEILVYNDFSTDNTAEIAEKYGAKVINGIKNQGCSFGKNALAEIANSEWIHFHDADDELLPNFTEVAQTWIGAKSCPDIVLLNFDYRDFKTNQLLGNPTYSKELLHTDQKKFVIENKLVNFAICNRAQFLKIGGFNIDKRVLYNEDRAFYAKAIVNELVFDYEPIITCINYRHEGSMSNGNIEKCAYAHFYVSEFLNSELGDQYPKEIAQCYWSNATTAASIKNWKLMSANILSALKLNGRIPQSEKFTMKVLCFINPFMAYYLRETLIRFFKPHLRK